MTRFDRLALLSCFLCLVFGITASFAEDESQEPPLTYEVKLDDKTISAQKVEHTELPGMFTNPNVTITPNQNRMFSYQGIRFQYPRSFEYKADFSNPRVKMWHLLGDNLCVNIIASLVDITPGSVVNTFRSDFRLDDTQVKIARAEMTLGTETLKGISLQVLKANKTANLTLDVFQVPSRSNSKIIITFNDKLDKDGNHSEEYHDAICEMKKSFEVKLFHELPGNLPLSALDVSGDDVQPPRVFPRDLPLPSTAVSIEKFQQPRDFPRDPTPPATDMSSDEVQRIREYPRDIPQVTITPNPNRLFSYEGITFKYPRAFIFHAGVADPKRKTWEITSNELRIRIDIIQKKCTYIKYSERIQNLLGPGHIPIKNTDAEIILGTETLKGTSTQFLVGEERYVIDIYQVPSQGHQTAFLTFIYFLNKDGNPSNGYRETLNVMKASFVVTPDLEVPAEHSLPATDMSGDEGQGIREYPRENPQVTITPNPNGLFSCEGITFKYPRAFEYKADFTSPRGKKWQLFGNNLCVSVYACLVDVAPDGIVNEFRHDFRLDDTHVKIASAEMTLGTETLKGISLQVLKADKMAKLTLDVFQLQSRSNPEIITTFNDKLDKDGNHSEEYYNALDEMKKSFEVKRFHELHRNLPLSAFDVSGDDVQRPREFPHDPPLSATEVSGKEVQQPREFPRDPPPPTNTTNPE